jgi:hypothetical protein
MFIYTLSKLHGVTFHKIIIFVVTTMRASSLKAASNMLEEISVDGKRISKIMIRKQDRIVCS